MLPSSRRMLGVSALLLAFLGLAMATGSSTAGNFYKDVKCTYGDGRCKIERGGHLLTLGLDKTSGSGFNSINEFHYGRFDMEMKLVPGNSAGSVTTFYLTSFGPAHNEIDMEFLGNVSGQPYTLHTNVYCQGKGDREEQFNLWFDPTKGFHLYSIIWNPSRIIFLVDNSEIRVFENRPGLAFPSDQPMKVYCSLWNAEEWATQGGRVKTDWIQAPFYASYRKFNVDGCIPSPSSNCQSLNSGEAPAWRTRGIDGRARNRIKYLQRHRVYNYCADAQRFPQGFPADCKK